MYVGRVILAVGIIANPSAGKDIRRLVAQGRFVPVNEMVNILRRVYSGLRAVNVDKVIVMPDPSMMCKVAFDGMPGPILEVLDMDVFGEERDSTTAGELMSIMDVGCVITLGGDGTNRSVVKGWRNVPLVPISTGTNNTFPYMVEGTVAGLAAGVVSQGLVDIDQVSSISRVLEVRVDGEIEDLAVVDVGISRKDFIGARAIWDIDTLDEIFLSRTVPGGIGLSAIGSRLRPCGSGMVGLHIMLGAGGSVIDAPIAPGLVNKVSVKKWTELQVGIPYEISSMPCTIALDGERSLTLKSEHLAEVILSNNGPKVISVDSTLDLATIEGVFNHDP